MIPKCAVVWKRWCLPVASLRFRPHPSSPRVAWLCWAFVFTSRVCVIASLCFHLHLSSCNRYDFFKNKTLICRHYSSKRTPTSPHARKAGSFAPPRNLHRERVVPMLIGLSCLLQPWKQVLFWKQGSGDAAVPVETDPCLRGDQWRASRAPAGAMTVTLSFSCVFARGSVSLCVFCGRWCVQLFSLTEAMRRHDMTEE